CGLPRGQQRCCVIIARVKVLRCDFQDFAVDVGGFGVLSGHAQRDREIELNVGNVRPDFCRAAEHVRRRRKLALLGIQHGKHIDAVEILGIALKDLLKKAGGIAETAGLLHRDGRLDLTNLFLCHEEAGRLTAARMAACVCALRLSHSTTKSAMRPIRSPDSAGTCPSSGITTLFRPGWRSRMASTVAAESRSELPPRMTRTGTRDKAPNSFHIAGSGRSTSSSASVRAIRTSYVGTSCPFWTFQARCAAPSHCSRENFGNWASNSRRR